LYVAGSGEQDRADRELPIVATIQQGGPGVGEAWQRFRKDTAPLFGTVVIGLVVTAAALARSEAVSSLHIGPVCFRLHFRRGLDQC
jgi:hypothetical protein